MKQKMNEILFREKYREFLKLSFEQEKDYLPMENGEYQYDPDVDIPWDIVEASENYEKWIQVGLFLEDADYSEYCPTKEQFKEYGESFGKEFHVSSKLIDLWNQALMNLPLRIRGIV